MPLICGFRQVSASSDTYFFLFRLFYEQHSLLSGCKLTISLSVFDRQSAEHKVNIPESSPRSSELLGNGFQLWDFVRCWISFYSYYWS